MINAYLFLHFNRHFMLALAYTLTGALQIAASIASKTKSVTRFLQIRSTDVIVSSLFRYNCDIL